MSNSCDAQQQVLLSEQSSATNLFDLTLSEAYTRLPCFGNLTRIDMFWARILVPHVILFFDYLFDGG